tara:strand:+ start:2028 stop:2240 length:213 start_codon:yes stop_codon:yes gene_type:complete
MVSKKRIKELELETLQDLFDYIVLSRINGQWKQVRSLIAELSKDQKKAALNYYGNGPDESDVVKIIALSL